MLTIPVAGELPSYGAGNRRTVTCASTFIEAFRRIDTFFLLSLTAAKMECICNWSSTQTEEGELEKMRAGEKENKDRGDFTYMYMYNSSSFPKS